LKYQHIYNSEFLSNLRKTQHAVAEVWEEEGRMVVWTNERKRNAGKGEKEIKE
jgi:hypothetical protein